MFVCKSPRTDLSVQTNQTNKKHVWLCALFFSWWLVRHCVWCMSVFVSGFCLVLVFCCVVLIVTFEPFKSLKKRSERIQTHYRTTQQILNHSNTIQNHLHPPQHKCCWRHIHSLHMHCGIGGRARSRSRSRRARVRTERADHLRSRARPHCAPIQPRWHWSLDHRCHWLSLKI